MGFPIKIRQDAPLLKCVVKTENFEYLSGRSKCLFGTADCNQDTTKYTVIPALKTKT